MEHGASDGIRGAIERVAAAAEDGGATSSRAPALDAGSAHAWQAIVTADGTPTLVHSVHGEACHSRAGAWQQARLRYASGCRIGERAPWGALERVRLLDVGTGLGLNVAAAMEALAGTGVELAVHGLERDRAVLARALALAPRFPPDARAWVEPVARALAQAAERPGDALAGLVVHGPAGTRARLHLAVGDARATLAALDPAARFDAAFLDPFSPRVEPPLWEPAFLAAVAARMAAGSWLATYSVSVAVRAGLVAAGLRVGAGPAVGTKREGTLASPDALVPPLAPRTARRVARRAAALALPPRTVELATAARAHGPGVSDGHFPRADGVPAAGVP